MQAQKYKRQASLHDDALPPSLVESVERTPEPRRERPFDAFVQDNELRILLSLRIPINYKVLLALLGLIGAGITAVALRWPEIVKILAGG